MTLRLWLGDGWFIFSTVIAVVILVLFALPPFFGFQNFVQWGGMYDDRWCTVLTYDKNPHEFLDARSETVVPGSDVHRVYSAPTHNRKTCFAQARARCGKASKAGWHVAWAEPEFQHIRYAGDMDVCNSDMDSSDFWFFYER